MDCFFHLLDLEILQLHLLFGFLSLGKESMQIEHESNIAQLSNEMLVNQQHYNDRTISCLCFFAGPNSIPLTRLAKFREQIVSLKSFSLGLIWTNMSAFESPPRNTKLFINFIIKFAYMQRIKLKHIKFL